MSFISLGFFKVYIDFMKIIEVREGDTINLETTCVDIKKLNAVVIVNKSKLTGE